MALRSALGERRAGATTEVRNSRSGGGVVIIEQHWSERLAHVPLDIVGEHAQQDVRPYPLFKAMVNGPRPT